MGQRMNSPAGIPSLADARKYLVNRPGEYEGIRQSLYDFQIYPTAGNTRLQFFQLPQGQGLSSAQGNANNAKTLADTNMESAGSLPAPKQFLLKSIEVVFYPGSVSTANTFTPVGPQSFTVAAAATIQNGVHDQTVFRQNGVLRLFIGSKDYLIEAPLIRFPTKVNLEGDFAVASNSATVGEVLVADLNAKGRPYNVEPPVFLISTQNFSVNIEFPVAVATPSGFNGRVGVILDGYLYRNSQ